MTLPSPHYRHDSTDGLSEDITDYLDQEYWHTIPYRDVQHPKLLVVFSGGNAMGKSTLSRRIAERFQALVIENDAVKRTLLARYPELERDQLNPLVWKYTSRLYDRLSSLTPNGLVVRDGVIDWYYDRILPGFIERGYEIFIIAFELSEAKSIELIRKRGDTPTFRVDRAMELLEDHAIHMRRFRAVYHPDVILTDDTIFDHSLVMDALAEKLASMS